MNTWFRMYAEFLSDPKVQMLSEADQRRYIMLLCMRCSNGDVTLQDAEVAFQLRISNDEWIATKARLTERDLIDADNKPTAWNRRQFVSDTSNSRVSRHRERKREASKRECNVTVAPPDTDSETDSENNTARSEQVAAREADGRTPIQIELKSVYNGSTEAMLAFVDEAMGGGSRTNAERWLASTTSAHGSRAVAQAFAALAEKQAAGEIIARPLPLWSSIAAGMKAGKPVERQPAWAAEKEARRKAAREAVFGKGGTA